MTEVKPFKAEHGMELLKRANTECPKQWYTDCEGDDRAFSIYCDSELACCAGIIHKMDGIGVAWALYPANIGTYHIDPSLAKEKMASIAERFNYRRIEATVRADFPVGHSYIRYLGFKVEGLMEAYEPDGSDAFLYARIIDHSKDEENQCEKCGCCCEIIAPLLWGKECEHYDTEKKLCKIYDTRPDVCRVKGWGRNKPYCKKLQNMRT